MLNRPFFIYWARVFLVGSFVEMIYEYFSPAHSFTRWHALLISFIIGGVIYLAKRKTISMVAPPTNTISDIKYNLFKHPILNYWARNFWVFSIVNLLFELVYSQSKLPILVMMIVSLILGMVYYFTLENKAKKKG